MYILDTHRRSSTVCYKNAFIKVVLLEWFAQGMSEAFNTCQGVAKHLKGRPIRKIRKKTPYPVIVLSIDNVIACREERETCELQLK